ncbi:PrpF protein [Yarrowia lipolytica]|jgi:2-methylaconitate cis-trans-isomerase PrpF|nr:2-methyl-aconitate isomerase [Yarrowia lipolytica]RDW25503.1 PrpF protein [Yarrowia lipolytica]RDW34228.1 PrpF protein [Yarrowia lipolytica]RDW37333.1 PrpF protein [Yarrowia lipolytica]RDW44886.1 PrpF protein [Yarrowia lipolytica]
MFPSLVRNAQKRLAAVWMRGGTSKGLFFNKQDVPADFSELEKTLLKAIGSPDPYKRQLNGMGGATSSTSKIVIINQSKDAAYDVDYNFGHVSLDKPIIDWTGNCGNLTAAVAHYAIEERLVKEKPQEEGDSLVQKVRIWQTNVDQRIIAHVPVSKEDGLPIYEGEDTLDGVSGTARAFRIDFLKPSSGKTLPTDNAIDTLTLKDGSTIEASLVNAGNPTVFVRAADLGLKGTELPPQLSDPKFLAKIEDIRQQGAYTMGLVDTPEDAAKRPATPKVSFVSKPQTYRRLDGETMEATDIDVTARIFSMGIPHGAYTGTGAVAIGIAALLEGSVVNEMATKTPDGMLRVGHTSGLLVTGGVLEDDGKQAAAASLIRTARRLMDGHVYV